jgi:hypothetical protein
MVQVRHKIREPFDGIKSSDAISHWHDETIVDVLDI